MANPASQPRPQALVLVVDDEDLVRRLMARTLAEAGFLVLEAGSGSAAVALLSADPYRIQLVVSDIAMPEMTGLELARVVAERWPSTPCSWCRDRAGLPTTFAAASCPSHLPRTPWWRR